MPFASHGHGVQVPQFPAGWTAQQDSSLHPRAGFVGVEFVSPVLRGVDGLQQARQVVETLNAWGCQVNKSCGFHVHVGFKSNDLRALRRLVHLCAYYEPAIYAATGTRSREHGDFCKPIKGSFRHLDFSARNITGIGSPAYDRYHLLNLSNLIYGRKPTVEFRAFAGTLNFGKIAAYVRLCVGLVERAISEAKLAAWEPGPAKWATTKGPGYNEVVRMIYTMGWRGTWRKHAYGRLTADGLPTLDESAEILCKMAARYDTADEAERTQ